MIREQSPNSEEIVKRKAIEIIHTLTFTVFHFTELFFIVAGPQIVKNEVQLLFIDLSNSRPHLMLLGLFTMEKPLLLAISAAIVSFLIILIQFQLECVACKQ
ncbi:hypothetical protein Bhyg_14886 [Pseudolycoriella hygida]|uniref:Uncharacterized protein n=1 Tax=Pseudolycoriella hygida TaxID=35572 RepID=A0A9Q0RXX3_9DIPT|nr:hypothetical protein Bhyg_14886 [Pseudolycoriella hygida]